jgi:hypothetical protein
MDFSQILNAPAAPPPQNAEMGYLGMTQPIPQEAQAMNKPAASPAEFEQRKAGWQAIVEKINSNPNILRAMGLAGASLLQSAGAGENSLTGVGRAYAVGQSAYDLGQHSEQQLQLQQSQEARAQAESAANIASKQASTKKTEVETGVLDAASQTRLERERAELEKLNVQIEGLKDENSIKKARGGLEKKILQIEQELPQSVIRDSLIAKYKEAQAKLDKTAAEIKALGAGARKTGAQAETEELTAEILKKMSPEEQKAFLTKSGKYSASQSAIAQQRDMWADLYDKLPAEDSNKKGKTREQFVMERLTTQKMQDAAKILADLEKSGVLDRDPDLANSLLEIIRLQVQARKGTPGGGGAAADTGEKWQPGAAGLEFRKKPDGTLEYRRAAKGGS